MSAIGDDTQKEACRKKQPEVCSFQDLVSRITDPTIRSGGEEAKNKTLSGTREWQEKRDWPSLNVTLGKKLDIHYTNTSLVSTAS